MDESTLERVRYYYANNGDWKAEATYWANLLDVDVLDIAEKAFKGLGFTDDDIQQAYEEGYEDGYDGGYEIGLSDGYDEGFSEGEAVTND